VTDFLTRKMRRNRSNLKTDFVGAQEAGSHDLLAGALVLRGRGHAPEDQGQDGDARRGAHPRHRAPLHLHGRGHCLCHQFPIHHFAQGERPQPFHWQYVVFPTLKSIN